MGQKFVIESDNPQGLLRLARFGGKVGLLLSAKKVPEGLTGATMTDAQFIEMTAKLLDDIDDATDAYIRANGASFVTERTIQERLRAIARRLDN